MTLNNSTIERQESGRGSNAKKQPSKSSVCHDESRHTKGAKLNQVQYARLDRRSSRRDSIPQTFKVTTFMLSTQQATFLLSTQQDRTERHFARVHPVAKGTNAFVCVMVEKQKPLGAPSKGKRNVEGAQAQSGGSSCPLFVLSFFVFVAQLGSTRP